MYPIFYFPFIFILLNNYLLNLNYKYSSRYKEDIDFKGKYEHRKLAEIYLNEIEDILKKEKYIYLYENKISIIEDNVNVFKRLIQFEKGCNYR